MNQVHNSLICLSIESLLMSENIALNGHTLKNYLYKMHKNKASKTIFLILNRPKCFFLVRQAFIPF